MWKKLVRLLCISGYLFSQTLNAQLLKLSAQQVVIDNAPPFNRNFIRKNNVTKISGHVSIKKLNDIIRETPLYESYQFNEDGLPVKIEKTAFLGKKIDTTIYIIQYQNGKIIEKTEWTGGAFLTKKFRYEGENLTFMEYYRQPASGKQKILLFSESFKTVKNTPQEKIIYGYNENNQHYKTITEQYDSYGNTIKRIERLEVSGKSKIYTFKYNEYHLLTEKYVENHLFQTKTERHTYQYDDFHNLVKEEIFKNGKPVKSIEYLYNKHTFLLSAKIEKEISSEKLKIIKYQTVFK